MAGPCRCVSRGILPSGADTQSDVTASATAPGGLVLDSVVEMRLPVSATMSTTSCRSGKLPVVEDLLAA